VEIGSRRELFVDGALIEQMRGVEQRLHSPVPREVALAFDAPWEGPVSTYVTVFRDEDRFRMYYRGQTLGQPETVCYAESDDGIVWRKPSLGRYEFQGSRENNIVWMGRGAHNFAAFKDENPGAPATQRYKAVAGGPLIALASPDGIAWEPLSDEPVIPKRTWPAFRDAFDSQNLAFWDTHQQQYVAYYRIIRDGKRDIARCTSPDFLHWSDPQPLDLGAAPREHLYTNATTTYFRAPHLYLSFPMRFVPERATVAEPEKKGVAEGVFMTSRDGLHWDRRFMEGFIRPSLEIETWTDRNNMPAWGVVPTSPEEISLYYVEHYRWPTVRLRRATLRTDGFVSVRAPYSGGELLTRPLTFSGRELVLNVATSAAGSVRVEIQDAEGRPLPGYTLADAVEIYGNALERVVAWKGGTDVSALAGQPVRLRFVMQDADLYTLQFRGACES
jgi:hypothetical protein